MKLQEQHRGPTCWVEFTGKLKMKMFRLLTYKILHGLAPFCLSALVTSCLPIRPRGSHNANLLSIPRINKSSVGGRAFPYQAPLLRLCLSTQICEASSVYSLKSKPKNKTSFHLPLTSPSFSPTQCLLNIICHSERHFINTCACIWPYGTISSLYCLDQVISLVFVVLL